MHGEHKCYYNEKRLEQEIKRLIPEYTAFLSNLVRIESVYGREKIAQLLVKSKMEEIGLDVKTFYSRNDDEESINLVSVIEGKGREGKGRSLVLNAHCDVAPIDDHRRWTREPFSGQIEGGYLYGRGAQDDKAGIAIIIMIVHVLKNLGIQLGGDLLIQSVIEDETTGNGSKVLIENGYTGDGVIIVDGTWSERIIHAHLGQVWVDVDITGEPVAACVQSRGLNPIDIAIEFILRIKEFILSLNKNAVPFESIDTPYFVNVGSLRSGVWHGSVPSKAEIYLQIGFPHIVTPDDMIEKLVEISTSISNRIKLSVNLLKTPAFIASKDNYLINKLKSIIERNSKKEVMTIAVTGHCDMRHFKTPNICLYGPGGGKNAHGIDEYYMLDQMPIVAKNLIDLVLEWCNEE